MHVRMVIPYHTAKMNLSPPIVLKMSFGANRQFNDRQYFRLYSNVTVLHVTALLHAYSWLGGGGRE